MSGTPIDLEKLRSIGYLKGGRSRPNTKEYRKDGHRVKETVDDLGNSTIEHDTKDDRVDVVVRPKTVVFGKTRIATPRVRND